jgi:hypothetical protein
MSLSAPYQKYEIKLLCFVCQVRCLKTKHSSCSCSSSFWRIKSSGHVCVLPAEKLPWWLYVSSAAKSLNIKSYVAVGVGVYISRRIACLLSFVTKSHRLEPKSYYASSYVLVLDSKWNEAPTMWVLGFFEQVWNRRSRKWCWEIKTLKCGTQRNYGLSVL